MQAVLSLEAPVPDLHLVALHWTLEPVAVHSSQFAGHAEIKGESYYSRMYFTKTINKI